MLAVMLLAGPTMLVSCGDDDDDNKNLDQFTQHDPALVGTWVNDESRGTHIDIDTYTFNSNGTYIEVSEDSERNGLETETEKGTWSTNADKNRIVMICTESDDPREIGEIDQENYRIDNGRLRLGDDWYEFK